MTYSVVSVINRLKFNDYKQIVDVEGAFLKGATLYYKKRSGDYYIVFVVKSIEEDEDSFDLYECKSENIESLDVSSIILLAEDFSIESHLGLLSGSVKIDKKLPANAKMYIWEFEVVAKDETCDFRSYLQEKYNMSSRSSYDSLLKKFYQDFYKQIDTEEFLVPDVHSKKGLSVYGKGESDQKNVKIHSEHQVIDGIIVGGAFGRKRQALERRNKRKGKDVNENDVVSDDYYFCLYLPEKGSKGYLFTQCFSDATITTQIKHFLLKHLFKKKKGYTYSIKEFVPYVSPSLMEQFKDGCILDRVSFIKKFANDDIGGADVEDDKTDIIVKVELSTPSEKPVPLKMISSWLNRWKKMQCNDTDIDQYPDKKVKLRDSVTGLSSTFELDGDLKLRPVINLSQYVLINNDGTPNIEYMRRYCFSQIEQIKRDTFC